MKCSMGACVNVHGVGRNLNQRNQIMKHIDAGSDNPPIRLINAVTSFATMNGSKIEGPVNVGIQVGEINVPTKWKEFVT